MTYFIHERQQRWYIEILWKVENHKIKHYLMKFPLSKRMYNVFQKINLTLKNFTNNLRIQCSKWFRIKKNRKKKSSFKFPFIYLLCYFLIPNFKTYSHHHVLSIIYICLLVLWWDLQDFQIICTLSFWLYTHSQTPFWIYTHSHTVS